MAKRPAARSRSQVDDGIAAAADPVQPRTRRSRVASSANPADAAVASTADAAVGTAVDVGPSDDDIRERAYQRYLERGGGHGMDFDDWVEAERELRTKSRG